MKDHDAPLQELSFIPAYQDIAVDYDPGTVKEVTLHDGSRLRLRKLEEDYDPTERAPALKRLAESRAKDEVLTGVFFVDPKAPTLLDMLDMAESPLATLPEAAVRPPREALARIMDELR